MNDEKIFGELEDFLSKKYSGSPGAWVYRAAEVVGVYTGVKPAAVFSLVADVGDEFFSEYEQLLQELGMKTLLKKVDAFGENEVYDLYFGKNSDDVKKLSQAVDEMRVTWQRTSDEMKAEDIKKRQVELDREIGRLVGYPETAIEFFVSRAGSQVRRDGADGDRYYIHSDNYEKEFESYEKPIHIAMEKLTPRAAMVMRNDRQKRWL